MGRSILRGFQVFLDVEGFLRSPFLLLSVRIKRQAKQNRHRKTRNREKYRRYNAYRRNSVHRDALLAGRGRSSAPKLPVSGHDTGEEHQ